MKLNQELIKRLADGEIAYQHTGTDEQWEEIKKACEFKNYLPFCKVIEMPIYCTKKIRGNYFEYYNSEEDTIPNLLIFTTEQLFEVDTEQIPDNEQPMDKIDFFKQLCASSYQLKSVQSFEHQISKAWEFTEMVYEKLLNSIELTTKL